MRVSDVRKIMAGTVLAASLAITAPADAKVGFIDGPTQEVGRHNPVIWHTHIKGTRWTYIELYDGSEWTATPCRQEDSRNCWWNAKHRGNGLGDSFLNLRGRLHYVDYRYQP